MCLGIPAQIVAIADPATHMATVMVSGARRAIDLSLLDEDENDDGATGDAGPLAVGDWVMAHAGLALSRISEQEARETLAVMQEMSDMFLGVGAGMAGE